MSKFKCISCTESSNGGFIAKLQNKVSKSINVFGVTKTTEQQSTYYIKVDTAIPVGKEDELPLGSFKVVERPFVLEDTGEEVMLKWLHL